MQFFTVLYLYFLQIDVLNIVEDLLRGNFISIFGGMETMQTSNKKTWTLNLDFNCRFLKTWFSFSSLPLSWHRSRFRYVACFFATCLNLFSNRSYIYNTNSNLFFRCHRNESEQQKIARRDTAHHRSYYMGHALSPKWITQFLVLFGGGGGGAGAKFEKSLP